MAQIERWRHA